MSPKTRRRETCPLPPIRLALSSARRSRALRYTARVISPRAGHRRIGTSCAGPAIGMFLSLRARSCTRAVITGVLGCRERSGGRRGAIETERRGTWSASRRRVEEVRAGEEKERVTDDRAIEGGSTTEGAERATSASASASASTTASAVAVAMPAVAAGQLFLAGVETRQGTTRARTCYMRYIRRESNGYTEADGRRGAQICAAAPNQSGAHNPPSVNILCHRVKQNAESSECGLAVSTPGYEETRAVVNTIADPPHYHGEAKLEGLNGNKRSSSGKN